MAFINFLRPKWQSSNVTVRLAAVQALSAADLETLTTVLREDDQAEVRLAALAKFDTLEQLEQLASLDLAPDTRQAVRRKINQLLAAAVLQANDGAGLEETLQRINDPEVLVTIATAAAAPTVRLTAIQGIDDQHLLCAILEQNCGKLPARAALDRINDETLLARASQQASSRTIRRLAAEKLAALVTARQPPITINVAQQEAEAQAVADETASRLKEQEQCDRAAASAREIAAGQTVICETIEGLIGSLAADAADRFQAASAQWRPASVSAELTTRFALACQRFNDTATTIARERETLARLEETGRETVALLASGDLATAEAQLAMAEKRLATATLTNLAAAPTRQRLRDLRQQLQEQQAAEAATYRRRLEENLEGRRAICQQIEAMPQAEKRTTIEKQLKELRAAWEALPALPPGSGAPEMARYEAALAAVHESQEKFHHEQDWQRWANKTRQEELIAAAEALDPESDLERVAGVIKDLQAQWKKIGPVPKEAALPLWEHFRSACDRNFIRCTPYFEEQDQRRLAGLERKEGICQEAAALADSMAWRKAADQLKALQAEWKGLPFTTRKEEDPLYTRFRAACDTFFARRQAHYQELEQEQQANREQKNKLCEAAEALADEPVWQNSKKLRELQELWKGIGHAPRDHEQQLWERFRAACDRFFAWIESQRQDNLAAKERLCQEVTALTAPAAATADFDEVAARLHELQQQWQQIGPVPNELREEIRARFHQPCEAFFLARQQHHAQLDQERQANQGQKEAILQQAEELLHGEAKEAADQLRELQRQWRASGPAPRQAEQAMNRRFQALCDGFFKNRHQHYEQSKAERFENLRQKEAILLKLENLVGAAAPPAEVPRADQALSLAERFRLAREANFMLAGKRHDRSWQKEEIGHLQQEWKKIGPVPREQDKPLWDRYKRALDAFYQASGSKPSGSAGHQGGPPR